MALTKSTIPVLFRGGLDQKTSEKLVVPGMFLALENCVRRKRGAIQKRNGFTALGSTIFGTTETLSHGTHLDTFEDDVIMLGNDKLYSYSSANNVWIDKGTCTSAQVTLSALVRNNNTQAMADIAYVEGLIATVYEDSAGGIRYSIYDDTTGAALVYNVVLDASGVRPKVVATQSGFVIGYITGATLVTRYVAKTTPTTLGAVQTIAGSGVSSTPWDMDTYANYISFAYNNTGSNVTIGYMTALGVVGSPGTNGLPSPVVTSGMGTAANALTVIPDAMNQRIWIGMHGSSGIVRLLVYSPDLVTTDDESIETIANIRNITGVIQAANGRIRLYYEQSAVSVKNYLVKYAVASWPGSGAIAVVTAATAFKRSVGLASRAFEVDGAQYVNVAHDSALQPTYFTIRQDGFVVSRILAGLGGGVSRDASAALKSGIPRVIVDSTGNYATVVQVRNSLNIDGGGTILATNKGIEKASLNFEADLYGKTLGRNYHIVGGTTLNYDGIGVTEHGFYIFPEDVTTAAVAAATTLATGNYSVRAIYEWTDGKGLIHRSAPSTLVTTAVTATNKITVTVPTLRITNKVAASINIVVYIAPIGTTSVFYRASVAANTDAADTVAIDVTAVTPTAEILYTTGGIYENVAPPAAKCIHVHKNRLFIGGTEDGLIYYTKTQVPQEGMAFQDVAPIRIDAEGGDVTTFGTLDDKLIIFKNSRIYYESGEGPTDAGAQNDYFVPLKVASDTGCVDARSVAEIPQGLIFKSEKGFALLSRRLGVSLLDGVDDYKDLVVTSATVLDKEQEVRFTTVDSVTLVYNYQFDQWSTFTNYAAASAVSGIGSYLHLKSDGTVNQEISGSFSDNGARITMAIETSWMAFAGIQGFQRVYKMLLLGDFISHHYTKIKVAYDYESAYTETIFFNTQTGLNSSSVYGEGATYGSVTPYGGTGSSVYQCRILPARQKCESFKLRIEDEDTIGSVGGGSFALVAITLEVGRKYGANKLGASKSVGNG